MSNSPVSDKDVQTVTNLLKKLEPGKLPLPIFLEVARLTVSPIVEIVPLRKTTEGNVEILLIRREDSDLIWPGMHHTPGTIIRASDKEGNFQDAFNRILIGELKGTQTKKPVFVGNMLLKVKRGMEASIIYWVEVMEEPKVGTFYKLDELPENIIDHQISFIKLAGEHFQEKASH